MNPIIMVLCTGGICSAIQGKFAWTGALLIIAMLLAGWDNWRGNKLIAKALKK